MTMTHVPPLIVAPCNAKREISGCRLRLCAECTSNCLTCYYDTDGVNLCQACEPRYSLSDDSLQCNRKHQCYALKNLYSRESVANMQAYGRRNKHTYIHIALVFFATVTLYAHVTLLSRYHWGTYTKFTFNSHCCDSLLLAFRFLYSCFVFAV